MINFILFLVSIILFTSLLMYTTVLWFKYKRLQVLFVQAKFDGEMVAQFLSKQLEVNPESELKAKDDFITFLSTSREWAYKYIEDVQSALIKFMNKVDPIVDYHAKYGDVMPMDPHTSQLNAISDSINELKMILPSPEYDTLIQEEL